MLIYLPARNNEFLARGDSQRFASTRAEEILRAGTELLLESSRLGVDNEYWLRGSSPGRHRSDALIAFQYAPFPQYSFRIDTPNQVLV